MTVIVVANPKGGVGKSTLSTNLAGYFAANGEWVALADLDDPVEDRLPILVACEIVVGDEEPAHALGPVLLDEPFNIVRRAPS